LNETPQNLAALLPSDLRAPNNLMFLPYLSGERTPHNDADIRGAFIGLDVSTTQADMVQAVFEGVSFALMDCYTALAKTGTELSSIFAIGGGAQSEYWLNIISTTLGVNLKLPQGREFGAALGAARLAICGVTGAAVADIMTEPKTERTIHPNTKLKPEFDAAYQRYAALYPALKKAL